MVTARRSFVVVYNCLCPPPPGQPSAGERRGTCTHTHSAATNLRPQVIIQRPYRAFANQIVFTRIIRPKSASLSRARARANNGNS